MADDIQIKAVPTTSSSNTSNSSGNAINSPVVAGKSISNGPVIDLRSLDQSSSGAQTTGQATGTGQSASMTAPVSSSSGQATGTAPQSADDTFTSANGQTYTLTQNVREKFPDLMKLIKETESMNDEEREYWFQILPIMTDEQIKKFRDILVNEKEQLAKLDKDYENELTKLNEKHLIEWKAFETKEKRKALTQAEQKSKAEEQSQEEDLLQRLSQV